MASYLYSTQKDNEIIKLANDQNRKKILPQMSDEDLEFINIRIPKILSANPEDKNMKIKLCSLRGNIIEELWYDR